MPRGGLRPGGERGRPPILSDPVRIEIQVERATLGELDERARERGTSRSALTRNLIERGLEHDMIATPKTLSILQLSSSTGETVADCAARYVGRGLCAYGEDDPVVPDEKTARQIASEDGTLLYLAQDEDEAGDAHTTTMGVLGWILDEDPEDWDLDPRATVAVHPDGVVTATTPDGTGLGRVDGHDGPERALELYRAAWISSLLRSQDLPHNLR